MKKTILAVFLVLLSLKSTYAQDKYILIIDSVSNVFNNDVSFPYWLNSNQTVRPGPNIKSISILEFKVDTAANNNLVFQKVINLKGWGKVPANKVWKIESIGVSNVLLAGPGVFASPKKYDVPGVYIWTVPPGVTSLTIEVWGGGGNGSSSTGAGGGGGGYGLTFIQVNPYDTFRIAVGGPGGISCFSNKLYATAGTSAGSSGGFGGTSNATFKINGGNGDYCTSGGGNGGNGGMGGKSFVTGPTYCCASPGSAPGGGGSGTFSNCGNYSGGAGQVIIYW